MLRRARHNLTYANVMATVAVFVALGGSSYAAFTLERGSVKRKHIAKNAVTSAKVANGKLLARDFKAGQLPSGPQGERGPQGLQGPQGDEGPQGPGAASLQFSAAKSFAPAQLLATVGPWDILAQCSDPFDVNGTSAALMLRGPGNAEVDGTRFANDANPQDHVQSVAALDGSSGTNVVQAYPVAGTGRAVGTVHAQSGTDAVVLTANVFANDNTGTCRIVGSAFAAG